MHLPLQGKGAMKTFWLLDRIPPFTPRKAHVEWEHDNPPSHYPSARSITPSVPGTSQPALSNRRPPSRPVTPIYQPSQHPASPGKCLDTTITDLSFVNNVALDAISSHPLSPRNGESRSHPVTPKKSRNTPSNPVTPSKVFKYNPFILCTEAPPNE